jgi:uncharacterized surface protein with fasciclin (FAS1) repeats
MIYKVKYSLIISTVLIIGLYSCKKWDEHTAVVNPAATETIFEQISKRTNLNKFEEYLLKTGLDKELNSSKIYTVWAPTDDALNSLDPAIISDSARLRLFMSNHISTQAFYTTNVQTSVRVPLLNGKRATLTTTKFDEASITEANFTARNGVLHIIDKAAPLLQNLWEFINSTSAQYAQNAFIVSQNFTGFDPSTAIIDSISSTTGLPIYKPGTGLTSRNRYNDQVYDLKNETKQYTYFLLNNAALKKEVDSLTTFYKTSTSDSTNNLSNMSVVRDAIVEGEYSIEQLPATLVSKFGVVIPINKNAIVETHRVSNGVVYIVNELNFLTKDKIQNLFVQGENPRGYFRPTGEGVNPSNSIFIRNRANPITKVLFTDLYALGHGIAGLAINYQISNVPSAKYKVYWVAVNDTISITNNFWPTLPTATTPNPSPLFQQRLAMGSQTATTFPYINVQHLNYNEVLLGEYTQTAYGTLNMFLIAALTGANNLTLDYIRLEPQF